MNFGNLNIPPEVFAIVAFVVVLGFSLLLLFLIRGLFVKQLTPEQLKLIEIEQAEAEAVNKLTQQNRNTGFDGWFAQILEEGGSKMAPVTAILIVFAVVLLAGGIAFIVSENVLIAAGTGMIAMLVPFNVWLIRRSIRLGKMKKAMPEALEALGDAIRGGLNLEGAFAMMSEQIDEPLKAEFQYANRQLAMGQTPESVMSRMTYRVPVPEFRLFTTAILVHRRTGGNLALLAERLARSARDRAEFRGHLRAVSAGSRFSILAMPFIAAVAVIFISGLDASYWTKFIMYPYGPQLLCVAVVLMILGGLISWKIMNIEY